MSEKTSNATTRTSNTSTSENWRAAVARVQSLSIFFVGMGIFALLGLVLHYVGMFADYQLTYFTVGAAIGAIGLLLGLVAR